MAFTAYSENKERGIESSQFVECPLSATQASTSIASASQVGEPQTVERSSACRASGPAHIDVVLMTEGQPSAFDVAELYGPCTCGETDLCAVHPGAVFTGGGIGGLV
jgi:hypothetical protein